MTHTFDWVRAITLYLSLRFLVRHARADGWAKEG